MALEYPAKTTVLYANLTKPSLISAIVTTGISTFVAGFGSTNLRYEDPWTMMKTSAISGTPTFEIQFSSAQTVQSFGVINHNLFDAGYATATLRHWNGSTYVSDGAITIMQGNMDIAGSLTSPGSWARWQINLGTTGSNFFVGSFFLGSRYVVGRNPSAFFQTRTETTITEQSAGGAVHTIPGAAKSVGALEMTFERGTLTDVDFFRSRPKGELWGILPPEHVDGYDIATGEDIFWGRKRDIRTDPKGPGGHFTVQEARYDYVVSLDGV